MCPGENNDGVKQQIAGLPPFSLQPFIVRLLCAPGYCNQHLAQYWFITKLQISLPCSLWRAALHHHRGANTFLAPAAFSLKHRAKSAKAKPGAAPCNRASRGVDSGGFFSTSLDSPDREGVEYSRCQPALLKRGPEKESYIISICSYAPLCVAFLHNASALQHAF